MGFNILVTARQLQAATHPASNFAGVKWSAGVDADDEDRLGERSPIAQLLERMERFLADRTRPGNGARSSLALAEAFACVPDEMGFPTTVDFRVVVDGQARELRADVRDEIFRIGREAIVNAYNHAQANRIEMEIEYRPAELRISVRDNGCGIDPQVLQRSENWGLKAMRERAECMGGWLRILTKVALGTEVKMCIPGRAAFDQP
ncbi:MAG TPA: ATP-binding protein [Bryobacteraceae bacterium]|nr:ATP-binding protein [Bryobacteraceae bacterium]